MQFKIKVIDNVLTTGTTKTNKPYKIAELTYRDLNQDKVTARKVTEYNKAYDTIAKAVKDEVYEITASKKEGSQNWDWDVAVRSDDASGKGSVVAGETPNSASGVRSAPKSTYATADERAATQACINRSAAVARAIEFLDANVRGESVFTVGDVIKVAIELDKFIVGGVKANPFADMKDDLVD